MDPSQLPALGGPPLTRGGAGPAAACKALKRALEHPSAAPSLLEGMPPPPSRTHHLAMTAAAAAKRVAGAEAGTGGVQRLLDIDALLSAMRVRLRAVQRAMVQDAAREQAAGLLATGQEAPAASGGQVAGACDGADGADDAAGGGSPKTSALLDASRKQRASALFGLQAFADALRDQQQHS